MNRLTTRNRKIVYWLCILVLFVPIFLLGMPATSRETNSGGKLAQLRNQYDLGESTFGDVDPSSAAMNLVLLGFRGIATNLLWMDHHEHYKTKNWAQLKSTANSIILLQPHYKEVWRYHGWNLAFNVSSQWDAVPDRYYWVKEGGKFEMLGSDRNQLFPELYWETGRILGEKIGIADEWRYYRQYFLVDPDPKFDGPDPAFNREGQYVDNFLAAKDSFTKANEVDLDYPQRMMSSMAFRSKPARSQFAYADALQREGKFDEITRNAWEEGLRDWTTGMGSELFPSQVGPVQLEFTEADVQRIAKERNFTERKVRDTILGMQNKSSYRYWKGRAQAESQPETVAAHRELYEGQELFKEGKIRESIAKLESGMDKFDQILRRYPDFLGDDNMVEEGMMAVLYYRNAHQLRGTPLPESYPLKTLWDASQDKLSEYNDRFRRENGR